MINVALVGFNASHKPAEMPDGVLAEVLGVRRFEQNVKRFNVALCHSSVVKQADFERLQSHHPEVAFGRCSRSDVDRKDKLQIIVSKVLAQHDQPKMISSPSLKGDEGTAHIFVILRDRGSQEALNSLLGRGVSGASRSERLTGVSLNDRLSRSFTLGGIVSPDDVGKFRRALIVDEEPDFACLHAYAAYILGYDVTVLTSSFEVHGIDFSHWNTYVYCDSCFTAPRCACPHSQWPRCSVQSRCAGVLASDDEWHSIKEEVASVSRALEAYSAFVVDFEFRPLDGPRFKGDAIPLDDVARLQRLERLPCDRAVVVISGDDHVRERFKRFTFIRKPQSSIGRLLCEDELRRNAGRSAENFQRLVEDFSQLPTTGGHSSDGWLAWCGSTVRDEVARRLKDASTGPDFLMAAALAFDGSRLLQGKPPVLAAELIVLQHTAEVEAEVRILGTGDGLFARERISRLEMELVDVLGASRRRRGDSAPLHKVLLRALTKIGGIYRSHGFIDEAEECAKALRWQWVWRPTTLPLVPFVLLLNYPRYLAAMFAALPFIVALCYQLATGSPLDGPGRWSTFAFLLGGELPEELKKTGYEVFLRMYHVLVVSSFIGYLWQRASRKG